MPQSYKVSLSLRGLMVGCIAMMLAATALGVEPEAGDVVKTMPKPAPHQVWVYDPDFPNLTTTQAFIIDGDKGEVLGMVDAGYQANLAFSENGSKFWVAETYYSRITRGERSDMVTVYDYETLTPQEEIPLPNGRFLVVTKRPNFAVTDSDRYLLSFNSTPATTVSVVDPAKSQYLGELSVPGCSHVFPSGESRFAMLCPDGGLASVAFDHELQADIKRTEPFFDPEADPVFEHAAIDRQANKVFFVSYSGTVYEADLSSEVPSITNSWSLESDSQGWRPGGWIPSAYNPANKELYFLMHEGGEWTHKNAGNQVWVFDANTGERNRIIELDNSYNAVAVSQDQNTQLYALSEGGSLAIYDAQSGELQHTVGELGITPLVLYTPSR